MGIGVTDSFVMIGLWNLYFQWFVISAVILAVPLLITRFARRNLLREVAIYVIGGFMFFAPIWFALLTELTGGSIIDTLLNGVDAALPAPGSTPGTIDPVGIGEYLLTPILLLMTLLGIITLRPSFIKSMAGPEEMPELVALKEDTAPSEPPPPPPLSEPGELEPEMPEVAPPTPDVSTVSELRELLIELNVQEPTINRIMGAGYATVTDLVATSPDQLVAVTGMDKKTAEDLHMAVQKKVWFGGI